MYLTIYKVLYIHVALQGICYRPGGYVGHSLISGLGVGYAPHQLISSGFIGLCKVKRPF